jgi:hypothetical protein
MRRPGLLLISLGVIACSSACSQAYQAPPYGSITGKWLPNDFHTSYLSLSFGKEAVFDNVGDTINVFTYYVDYPTRMLWLTDAFKETRSAKILKLDKDSLVFSHLWDLKTVQRFHRSNKK